MLQLLRDTAIAIRTTEVTNRGALPPARRGKGIIECIELCGLGGLEPQKYKALVDTGAQCTLRPLSHEGTESVHTSGVTGGSRELTMLETEISLTDWQKHPIVTGPEAPYILGIDYLRRGYFKDPKGYRWAFGIAAVDTERVKQLSALPGLSEDLSVVALLRLK